MIIREQFCFDIQLWLTVAADEGDINWLDFSTKTNMADMKLEVYKKTYVLASKVINIFISGVLGDHIRFNTNKDVE